MTETRTQETMNMEEWIKRWTAHGEEDIVGENLTLNRAPVEDGSLPELQRTVPDGTEFDNRWGFGDDAQRIWFNPFTLMYAGFSEISHSLHVWRYANTFVYLKHAKELGEFFGRQPFTGYDELVQLISDADTPDAELDKPVRELLTITDPDFTQKVLGPVLDTTARELQINAMMEQLAQ